MTSHETSTGTGDRSGPGGQDVDVDVLVVGGGPVGVTSAILLAQRGFTVRILERSTEIYDLPRAIGMDDEIQRVFQNAGLRDELAAITTPMLGAEFVRTGGERIIGIDLPLGVQYPHHHHPVVFYYQPQLEEMLRSAAARGGVELCEGVDVESVGQTTDGVSVHTATGTQTARWLIAADGASSRIRKQLGIGFVDQGFDQDWLVLDARLRRGVPTLPTCTQQICDPLRPTTFVPGHGDHRRWEFQLQPGESREEMATPDRVWNLLEPWMTPDDAEVIRAVVYRFHATVADGMRDGRIFLAGDSAHQMPPFLGQGLCSGIRDAANLAWKLRLVDDGLAHERFLDTYAAERLPHAARIVADAVESGRLIDELSGRTSAGTGLDAGYGGDRPSPRLEHGLLVGDHPAVGRQIPQPVIDGRPLDDLLGTGFALVLDDASVVGDLDPRWVGLATVVTVATSALPFTLPPAGAVVVRPDRYVAAVAHDHAEFVRATDALHDILRPPTND